MSEILRGPREPYWAEFVALWGVLTRDPRPGVTLGQTEAKMLGIPYGELCDQLADAAELDRYYDELIERSYWRGEP